MDIAFYSVGGDTGFGTILIALHAFGIPWALVCDGQSFDVAQHWSTHVFRQIKSAGIDVADLNGFIERVSSADTQRAMTQELWEEQLRLAGSHGVLTLATSWFGAAESFEGFVECVVPGKLAEADGEVGSGSKIRKGRWVAQETECPAEVNNLYKRLLESLIGGPRDEVEVAVEPEPTRQHPTPARSRDSNSGQSAPLMGALPDATTWTST